MQTLLKLKGQNISAFYVDYQKQAILDQLNIKLSLQRFYLKFNCFYCSRVKVRRRQVTREVAVPENISEHCTVYKPT